MRLIYDLFLQGLTPHAIAKRLTEMGILTPRKKAVWNQCTVRSILTNEKCGDPLPAVSAATSVVKITADSAPGIRTAALILYGGARLPQSAPVPASKKKR